MRIEGVNDEGTEATDVGLEVSFRWGREGWVLNVLRICMSVYLVLIGILQRAVMHLMQLSIESVTSCLYIQCVEYTLTIFPEGWCS